MKLARVVGTVVATVKNAPLSGKKLLVIKPIDRRGTPCGKSMLALDSIGAGVGENVFYVRGKEGSFPWYPQDTPSDCSIVGILDNYNFERQES
ncbi:MAG: EutN/CcmL family microcompartment protein [Acidobacteriota bacterium]